MGQQPLSQHNVRMNYEQQNVSSGYHQPPDTIGFRPNVISGAQNPQYGGQNPHWTNQNAPLPSGISQNVWPTPATTFSNCPPGLECLLYLDKILIRQQFELVEMLIGFETQNRYEIFDSGNQKIFFAKEDSHCCSRNCCGQIRPFEMSVTDNAGREVIRFERPLACDSCCFPCCLQNMKVYTPPGVLVGSVSQDWSICKPHFTIKNASEDTLLYIEGPICTLSICKQPVDFIVLALDKHTEVGRISKNWSGLLREIFTDADFFGISFPLDLDVRMKAVMLGACFLIDYMFFEGTDNDLPGMMG